MKSNSNKFSILEKRGIVLSIFLILFFLSFPLINAESFGFFEKGNNITLFVQCQNATYLNISKIFTNKNIYVNSEKSATKSVNSFNYTFLNSSEIGTYFVNYHCDLNSIDTPASSYFVVNVSGYETGTPQIFVMFFIIAIIFLIGLMMFIFGIKTEVLILKIFFLSLTVLMIVFLVGYILGIANITIGEFDDVLSGFTPLYVLFISSISVGGIGLVLYLIVFSLDAFRRKRGLKL